MSGGNGFHMKCCELALGPREECEPLKRMPLVSRCSQERGFTISPLNRAQNTQNMVSSLPWVLHIGILVLNSGMPARSSPASFG